MTFEEAIKEWGLNDFFGIWLLPSGMFLNVPSQEDHRICVSDTPWEWISQGAVSLRKCAQGVLYVRVLKDHFYPFEVRDALSRVFKGATEVHVGFWDDGYREEAETWYGLDIETYSVKLTDPIAWRIEYG